MRRTSAEALGRVAGKGDAKAIVDVSARLEDGDEGVMRAAMYA